MKRNQRCHCGSGKKYKKCCLKDHASGLLKEPEKMTRADLREMQIALGEKMPEEWQRVMHIMDREQRQKENEIFEKLTGGMDPLLTAGALIMGTKDRHMTVAQNDPDLAGKVKEFFLHEAQGEKA